ncbi:MAG: alpha-isopropylmalate synthase regulatory domain-containing protein, partial [Patescibacteria group bacterium]|nr:alpha-isopropylmalate synthase regulatory domain-containing protein [Patescibacteria group bacterium]
VEVTVNGIGERAGNTALEEIAMAIRTRSTSFPVEMASATEQIVSISRLVQMITGMPIQPNKAIVGANAFAHEAGIHQDGVLKNPMTYEIMRPESVGLTSNIMPLGKHSGRKAVIAKLREMGYVLSNQELNDLFAEFKKLADKKKVITGEDLEVLVSAIVKTPETFRLDYLLVAAGTDIIPTATIRIINNDGKIVKAEFGNGPIDAVFNTIAKITSSKAELARFSISGLTGGTDAQGEVIVCLKENGWTAIGRGVDPDIIVASAKAYLNGLNRLEYLRANPPVVSPNDVLS